MNWWRLLTETQRASMGLRLWDLFRKYNRMGKKILIGINGWKKIMELQGIRLKIDGFWLRRKYREGAKWVLTRYWWRLKISYRREDKVIYQVRRNRMILSIRKLKEQPKCWKKRRKNKSIKTNIKITDISINKTSQNKQKISKYRIKMI